MVATAQAPRSILAEFDLPGRRSTEEERDLRSNPYDGAFQTLATTDGAVVPAGTTGSADIVQVRGRKPGPKGGDNDNGNNNNGNGTETKPDDNRNNDRNNNGNGRNNRREFDLDLEGGQNQDQNQGQEAGQTASGGLRLAWENPLGLVDSLVDLSGNGESPQRPAYGMTVGHRSVRTARR
ncbi:hypothetical protein [Actinorugispora endophytica]|uniref:Uncharacterized protein n=1 Tax=Actinorugispora endophytica TaxID=1605990 RepID=A0A4R6V3Q3_9ACTN|nr:hypothetical protein [Actinorugispora endophytica]TDQ55015.1 hypothetical protein EV190_101336 [Actinorugispora endophytica]